MLNKLPKIAFIDDGIDPAFLSPRCVCFENYTATCDGVCISTPVSGVTHGTMCYQIFDNHVKFPYQIVSIKVLDSTTGLGNYKALVEALEWCVTQDFDVINMSMGTRQYTDFAPIAVAVRRLDKSTIVAACSNENEFTFPACLPNVIGVRHVPLAQLAGSFAYVKNSYDQIQVMTCVRDEPICFGDGQIVNMDGANSFAAPIVTARICNYLHMGCPDVPQQLEADSVKDLSFASYEFYKACIRNWESCTVPVVEVPHNIPCASSKLKSLLEVFIADGYRAIAISTELETDAASCIFNLHRHGLGSVATLNMIELYYNFMLPDIIFLQTNNEVTLPENFQADVVADINRPAQEMLEYIVRLLS